jgi:polyhydroxybutyrate depolymerase
MSRLTHFSNVADEGAFIAVYPDGVGSFWADGRGVTDADDSGIDDVGFLMALMDAIGAQVRIDPTRVFVTGISNGGFMAQRLACERADRFSAIASVGATLPERLPSGCRQARAVSALFINGTDDPLIPYVGGVATGRSGRSAALLSAPASTARWAELCGCSTPPTEADLVGGTTDGTRLVRTAYTGGRDGAEVVLVTVAGGGHTWPGGIQYAPARMIGRTSRAIDASRYIWEFFAAHARS